MNSGGGGGGFGGGGGEIVYSSPLMTDIIRDGEDLAILHRDPSPAFKIILHVSLYKTGLL